MRIAELIKEKREQLPAASNDFRKWIKFEEFKKSFSTSISNSFAGPLIEKLVYHSPFQDPIIEKGVAATFANLKSRVGQEVHLSEWCKVTQDRINRFAEVTGDLQWIHVDEVRAKRESPYRSTVAHGFLILSMVPKLRELDEYAKQNYPGSRMLINCGFSGVSFSYPVKPGQSIRSRTWLRSVTANKRSIDLVEEIAIEIGKSNKTACTMHILLKLYVC